MISCKDILNGDSVETVNDSVYQIQSMDFFQRKDFYTLNNDPTYNYGNIQTTTDEF